MRKELRRLQRLACSQGWRIEVTGGGHMKWLPPNGPAVFTSSTPSDKWALVKIEHGLKKAGLQLTG